MGWNRGWTIFEVTVIKTYDLGKLDKEMLAVLMEPYRGTDIDYGGKVGLVTKDDKEAEQVAIEAFGLKMPEKPSVEPPDYGNWRHWTEDEKAADDQWDSYHEAVGETFGQATSHFGWR